MTTDPRWAVLVVSARNTLHHRDIKYCWPAYYPIWLWRVTRKLNVSGHMFYNIFKMILCKEVYSLGGLFLIPNLFAICNNTFSKWWEMLKMSCRRVLSNTTLLVRGSGTVWVGRTCARILLYVFIDAIVFMWVHQAPTSVFLVLVLFLSARFYRSGAYGHSLCSCFGKELNFKYWIAFQDKFLMHQL
jgi:hypothetical protein